MRADTDNIVFLATANFGGYTGTFTLDEALLDRFKSVMFADYDTQLERAVIENYFPEGKADAIAEAVDVIRSLYKDMIIPSPLSTRMLINWGEAYKRNKDIFNAAEETFLYRIVAVDRFGYPDNGQLEQVRKIVANVAEA